MTVGASERNQKDETLRWSLVKGITINGDTRGEPGRYIKQDSKEDYKETELVLVMMMMLDGYLCHDDDTFVHTPY